MLCPLFMIAQIQINGVISDETGQPLPGATILEKNTNNGVVTDFDGNYSIQISDANSKLMISFVGYSTQEISIEVYQISTLTLNLVMNLMKLL